MLRQTDIRILLIEDNPGDADLIEAYLEPDPRVRAELHRVETLGEALDAVASDPGLEVALLDLSLPDSEGIETLERLREAAPRLPIILLTGSRNEEMVWAAVQRGADDYLPKDELTPELLARSVRYTLDRADAERSIRRREEWFRSLVESVTDLVLTVDRKGRVEYVSPSQEEILGHAPGTLRGTNVLDLVHPEHRDRAAAGLGRLVEGAEATEFELEVRTADERWRVVAGDARNLMDTDAVDGIVVTGRDITEAVERERLLRSQARELTERVKEQRCLRRVLAVLHRAADRPRDVFREVVEAIPDGFQHPDTTEARLVLEGEVWETTGFTEAEWSMRCPISGVEDEAGSLVVVRTALGDDEPDPFIAEERPLLEAIAGAVGDALLRAHASAELQRREAYYRSITEHSTDILAILDEELTPRYVSPSAEEVLDIDLAGIEGSLYELVHPVDRGPVREIMAELMDRPREVRRSEARVRVRDEWRTIEFAARNLLDDPDIRGIVVNGRDITERRRTEERYRTLFHTMSQGVVYHDGEGAIISANPAAERILGLTVDQMKGRTPVHPEWRTIRPDGSALPGDEHPASIALRAGRPVRDVLMGVFNPEDGSTRWIRVDAQPQFRPGDIEPYQVYATFADVTGRVESETELRRKDAILEAVSVAAEQFLTAEALEAVVPGVLETLGRATDVGEVDLWSLSGEGTESGSVAVSDEARWTADGHPGPEPGVTRPFPEALDWLDRLRRGESVHAASRDEVSGEEQAYLDRRGVRSVALIPVMVDGELWGVLRLLDRRRTHGWSDAEVDALGVAGAILGAAVQRRRDEEKLRERDRELLRAQKMEAVGRLAGGIAHDFNNLLTAIGGYASFISEHVSEAGGIGNEIEEIRRAADRGGRLTRQLLAFSRQQVLEEKPVDPGRVVQEIEPLLRRLIGEHIRLSTRVPEDPYPVRMDPSQLEQILMNLVLNARDAVEDGGRIEIAVESEDIGPEARPMLPDVPPAGRYTRITVRDDGGGMDAETREKVFEPFFTTKEQGKGTGLGLATVYGIVEGVGGYIELISEPGVGTRVVILIPATDEAVEKESEARFEPRAHVASGTVLVVEDEDGVRGVAVRALERDGYSVIAAENGRDALEKVDDTGVSIDVVLTDVVMPEVGGVELARRLRERFPEMKVLLTSGYTQDELVQKGLDDHELAFIPKPYTPAELTGKVAAVLSLEPTPATPAE